MSSQDRSKMTGLLQDLRFALRQLRKNPGFTAVAVLTLALGIGANAAIFSAIKALLLHPFPYPNSDQIVQVWSNEGQPLSTPDFLDIRSQNKSFEEIGVYNPGRFNLGGDNPESVYGMSCTAGAIRALGMRPALGRWPNEADEQPGAAPVALISRMLWARSFASDPGIVGRSVRLNGIQTTVIGVMPADFEFQSPWFRGNEYELWAPLALDPDPSSRGSHWLGTIGRLKPGVTLQSADAELKAIGARLSQAYPESNLHKPFLLHSFRDEMTHRSAFGLWILMGAVAMVLLVACANVAGMLLARGARRQAEFGVRFALGATRGQIIRLLLSESALLALIASSAGVLLALGYTRLLQVMLPVPLARAAAMQIDAPVLLFSIALAFVTALVFGLPPAFTAAHATVVETLKEGAKSQTGSRTRHRFLRGLVVAQIAIGLVLANGAVLLSLSYLNVLKANRSLDTDYVLSTDLWLRGEAYQQKGSYTRFWDQLLEKVQSLPGVKTAAVTSKLPLEGGNNGSFLKDDEVYSPKLARTLVERSYVSSGYFAVMDLPLLRGRTLNKDDAHGKAVNVVVNRALAEKFWPGENPLGKRVRPNDANPPYIALVVGVVENTRQWGSENPALPEIYLPHEMFGGENNPFLKSLMAHSFLVVRTTTDAHTFTPLLRNQLTALDHDLPMANVRTMKEVVGASTRNRRVQSLLIDFFMITALVLAAVGIYGTLSYQVLQRTREIGVRLAFGAAYRDIFLTVARQAGVWVVAGLGIGLVGTYALSSLLRSLVYEISPFSPLSLLAGVGLAIGTASLACLLPARRAARLDPMVALRHE
jgi:putative ABC transport system permease protein